MRRISTLLGVALIGSALLPAAARAQVVVRVGQPYPPVIVTQPVRSVYYVAPSVTYSPAIPSYSYYPPTTVYSPPVVSYSAPIISYAPPAAVVAPSVVQTRTYYGYGIFRPRGYYSETRVYP